jgi:hypothetical protein
MGTVSHPYGKKVHSYWLSVQGYAQIAYWHGTVLLGIGVVPIIMGKVPQTVHLEVHINNPLQLEKCPSLLAKYQVLLAVSKVFIGRGKVPIILFKVPI